MGGPSRIEWTEATWNPVTGCTKVSPGCAHCYAERMATRLQAMGMHAYRNRFQTTLQPQALDLPFRWRRSKMIFVNSMSDLFHRDVPDEFILRVFDVMRRADWHTFQILTKRSERLLALNETIDWPGNVWMGVSVESESYTHRIDDLRATSAKLKFLSLEPLLGPLPHMNLTGIGWVIVGGESGPGCRPMRQSWVTDIRDQCLAADVPFFFKQWGGTRKKKTGRELDGQMHDGMPVREHRASDTVEERER
jgi:protein gp37